MKKQRAIDAIALYEQLSTEVGSMLKQPPGIIVSKIMAMILQAPTLGRTSKMVCPSFRATSTAMAKSPSPLCSKLSSGYTR